MMTDKGKKTESGANIDRRKARRYPFVQLVWYKILEEQSDRNGYAGEGISRSCDISESGVGLLASSALPVGRSAFLEIPAKGFNFSGVGQIVYSHKIDENYHRVGIRFSVIPPNNRMQLNELLERSNGSTA